MLRKTCPETRLAFVVLVFVFFVSADGPLGFFASFAVLEAARRGFLVKWRKAYLPLLRFYPFFVTILFFNAFFFDGEHVLFELSILRLTEEGIAVGIEVCSRVFLSAALANVLSASTDAVSLSDAISWYLSPLRIFRIPVDDAAGIVALSFSFIPKLEDDAGRISKAMKARGITSGRKLSRLILPLTVAAFRHADELSIAMQMRGYDGRNRRKAEKERFGVADILILLFSMVFCMIGVLVL